MAAVICIIAVVIVILVVIFFAKRSQLRKKCPIENSEDSMKGMVNQLHKWKLQIGKYTVSSVASSLLLG